MRKKMKYYVNRMKMHRKYANPAEHDLFGPFHKEFDALCRISAVEHELFEWENDAGFKAFATDRPFGPDVVDIPGTRYGWAGDEFGYVFFDHSPNRLGLGDRVRFIPPHCDPTVNLYDRIHVCHGEEIQEIWPVMDRYHAD